MFDADDVDVGVAMVTARHSYLQGVPRTVENQCYSVSHRRPSPGGATSCREVRAPSADHTYDDLDESTATFRYQSGNCGQEYQEIDDLIKPSTAADQTYLTPVDYSCAGAVSPSTAVSPYEQYNSDQVDNGHVYTSPGKPEPAIL